MSAHVYTAYIALVPMLVVNFAVVLLPTLRLLSSCLVPVVLVYIVPTTPFVLQLASSAYGRASNLYTGLRSRQTCVKNELLFLVLPLVTVESSELVSIFSRFSVYVLRTRSTFWMWYVLLR